MDRTHTADRAGSLDLVRRVREPWDVVVIGGGATGLGCAVDAAARGYRTLLLEQSDFAKGTSSRSTKLIHGGVRYLRQGNLRLLVEALRERERLARNAPHLVRLRPFVVPIHDRWKGWFYQLGLGAYDRLAGFRSQEQRSRQTTRLSREEALARLPGLRSEGLRGGILYHDGQFDDARLAIGLVRTLFDLDGIALNYVQVEGLVKAEGRISGVKARDVETGEEIEIRSRVVVNATGIFVDRLTRMDDPAAGDSIALSQGIHLVLDSSFLGSDSALLIPSTDDGRVLFAIPWSGRLLVGTTDTPVETAVLEPRPLDHEIDFVLEHAGRYLARRPERGDVLSAFAGLRPLIAQKGTRRTSSLSREHAVRVSGSGLVTVAGGKWTTYRKMGEDAIDRAAAVAGLPRRPCATRDLKIHGAAAEPAGGTELPTDSWPVRERRRGGGVELSGPGQGDWRWRGYGTDLPGLRELIGSLPGDDEPLVPDLPICAGEVLWSARHEMARTVEDVLARRTRCLLLDARSSMEAAGPVAAILAAELGKDTAWQAGQVQDYRELAGRYLVS